MAKLPRAAFARLISSISSVTGYDFTEHQINGIDDIIDFEPPARLSDILPVAPKVSETSVNDLLSAVKKGEKINAIKAYRVLTGSGLKESKDAVEANWPSVDRTSAVELKSKMLRTVWDAETDVSHVLRDFLPRELDTIHAYISSFEP